MSHVCPKTGCARKVPDDKLACPPHWFSLSLDTRNQVWTAYLAHGVGSDEHTEAVTKAVAEMNGGTAGG